MSRLLLIDDDRAICEALSLALRRLGHDVATAMTGEGGMQTWRTLRPELSSWT